jgi:bis(5'-nucleosyl)-tetraphosphatase (symmetrical)
MIDFLLQQPLVIEHENALLLHAGVPPNWDKNTLLSQSFMVEKHLKKSLFSCKNHALKLLGAVL